MCSFPWFKKEAEHRQRASTVHSGGGSGPSLTWGLDLGDVLQQLLSLVDDVEGQVVHGKGFVCVMLEPLLSQSQILGVEVVCLLGQLLVPWLQVWDDLNEQEMVPEDKDTEKNG